ncbi:MAG: 3-dehydroquinate synthase family protein [Elusimicrobiales bacterium]|nr:3-dehydroquinate synthase family protein [Elusimicrobiales bacterium]
MKRTVLSLLNREIMRRPSFRLACGRNVGDISVLLPEVLGRADHIALVTDRSAAGSPALKKMLGPSLAPKARRFSLPAGREKTPAAVTKLCSDLFKAGFSRQSVLIAAGGGAVTDAAGFAASLYMRGINWVSVPTTLLGQIDAGIGGKTAVDFLGTKNIIGSFHQPALTVCDTAFLSTLRPAVRRAAAGELIKYALIGPGDLRLSIMRSFDGAMAGRPGDLLACVRACAEYKAGVCAADEREETGLRETLNFGHTAGHAFEILSGGRLPHGEAVLWGLRYALKVSEKMKVLDNTPGAWKTAGMIDPLPLPAACRRPKAFLKLVRADKKRGGRDNRFLLLRSPGDVEPADNIPERVLLAALEEI